MTLLAALLSSDKILVTEPISFSCFSYSCIKATEEQNKTQPRARSAVKYSRVGEGAAKLLTRSFPESVILSLSPHAITNRELSRERAGYTLTRHSATVLG